jgi:ankyrin repeat protein
MDEALFGAARAGDVAALAARLDADPTMLHARADPYGASLLHIAAAEGRAAVVDLLLARGST